MNTKALASATALALSLSTAVHAVHLDPGGRGQVLIYPYYTVNSGQQTLLSVTNTASVAQALKVRFKEGYNGRDVLDFNLFLSPFDSWTGTIFALEAVGEDSEGAAVLSADTSCTAPHFSEGDGTINGNPFVSLRNHAFVSPGDGGPYGIGRTREGYVEIYAMADIAAPLSSAIAHGSNGSAPTGCSQVRNLQASNAALSAPTGGLMGSISVIAVAKGTYLSARAEALAGFTASNLVPGTPSGSSLPNLGSVNDGIGSLAARATAQVVDTNGKFQSLTYPGSDPRSRKVDAVSAVLMADRVYNEYQIAATLGAASDWLLTLPTKPFYTDALYTEAVSGGAPISPFDSSYDGSLSGNLQYSPAEFSRLFYSRQGIESGSFIGCGFLCPPLVTDRPSLARTINVLPVALPTAPLETESAVLGSRLLSSIRGYGEQGGREDSGWMRFNLDAAGSPHALLPSAEGKVLRGLPVIGFWASNVVNNNVGNGVLANYAAAVRHATSVTCVKASDGAPCD